MEKKLFFVQLLFTAHFAWSCHIDVRCKPALTSLMLVVPYSDYVEKYSCKHESGISMPMVITWRNLITELQSVKRVPQHLWLSLIIGDFEIGAARVK